MKKIFITYGDEHYRLSLERIRREAEATGEFDEIRVYTPADLPEPFLGYTRTYRRGGGYWLWKPYIIRHTLDEAAEGDIVVYADSGCTLYRHKDWKRYFKLLEGREELFFLAKGRNRKWCRKSVFDFFHAQKALWKDASQVQATFIMARKCRDNEVITRWYELAAAHSELFVDVAPADLPGEDPKFREHRHDQSVLTACVCTSRHQERFALQCEKLEDIYPCGQAALASRKSDHDTHAFNRRCSRGSFLFRTFLEFPLRQLIFRLSCK